MQRGRFRPRRALSLCALGIVPGREVAVVRPGAASGLACRAAATFDGWPQALTIGMPLGLAIAWLVPIVQLVHQHPGTRAAWPNLFPLSNLALAAWSLRWATCAWLLAAFSVVIAIFEVRGLFGQALHPMRRTWRRERAVNHFGSPHA